MTIARSVSGFVPRYIPTVPDTELDIDVVVDAVVDILVVAVVDLVVVAVVDLVVVFVWFLSPGEAARA
jgi:hypothetical protein